MYFSVQHILWNVWIEGKIPMKKKLLGYYNYTVVLTYCGMLFAFCGILQAIEGCFRGAVLCLMLAGLCDLFDGTVAATKERTAGEKNFGIQIDSLSDLISFGVMPGMLVYMMLGKGLLAGMLSGFFVLCALIRLAYFNVLEEERQKQTAERRKTYQGVPVTTIALTMPAVFLLYETGAGRYPEMFIGLLLVHAVCFLLPIEIKKPKTAGTVAMIAVGLMEMVGMVLLIVMK